MDETTTGGNAPQPEPVWKAVLMNETRMDYLKRLTASEWEIEKTYHYRGQTVVWLKGVRRYGNRS